MNKFQLHKSLLHGTGYALAHINVVNSYLYKDMILDCFDQCYVFDNQCEDNRIWYLLQLFDRADFKDEIVAKVTCYLKYNYDAYAFNIQNSLLALDFYKSSKIKSKSLLLDHFIQCHESCAFWLFEDFYTVLDEDFIRVFFNKISWGWIQNNIDGFHLLNEDLSNDSTNFFIEVSHIHKNIAKLNRLLNNYTNPWESPCENTIDASQIIELVEVLVEQPVIGIRARFLTEDDFYKICFRFKESSDLTTKVRYINLFKHRKYLLDYNDLLPYITHEDQKVRNDSFCALSKFKHQKLDQVFLDNFFNNKSQPEVITYVQSPFSSKQISKILSHIQKFDQYALHDLTLAFLKTELLTTSHQNIDSVVRFLYENCHCGSCRLSLTEIMILRPHKYMNVLQVSQFDSQLKIRNLSNSISNI